MTCKVATWLIKWLHDVVMWLHKVVMWLHKVVMWLHKVIMRLHVTGSMNLATILCDHSCSHVTSCHQLSYSDYFRSQIWFTWVWMLGTSSRWWYGLGTFGKLHNQSEPRTLHFQTFIIKHSSVNFNTCWIMNFSCTTIDCFFMFSYIENHFWSHWVLIFVSLEPSSTQPSRRTCRRRELTVRNLHTVVGVYQSRCGLQWCIQFQCLLSCVQVSWTGGSQHPRTGLKNIRNRERGWSLFIMVLPYPFYFPPSISPFHLFPSFLPSLSLFHRTGTALSHQRQTWTVPTTPLWASLSSRWWNRMYAKVVHHVIT